MNQVCSCLLDIGLFAGMDMTAASNFLQRLMFCPCTSASLNPALIPSIWQSGNHGFFFEPRNASASGPHESFAIIWLPQLTLADALHRVHTTDHCITVCRLGRLGQKYGIRVLTKHHKEVHKQLCPQKPFVACTVKAVYRLEPLPAGTQRASLVTTLQGFGWNAKPLQPCKGSQGQAWHVGSDREPPQPYLEAQHGWITITKVKDQAQPQRHQGLIAISRTKLHIKESSAGSSTSTVDPWSQGPYPWSGYQKASKPPPVASQNVQSRFDDVEQRLQDRVNSTLQTEVQKLQANSDTEQRMNVVESQIQSLVENQSKLEHWISDGSSKVFSLQQDCAHIMDFSPVGLGTFNHSGISNKFHMLDYMPVGWWHATETQASKAQQWVSSFLVLQIR